MNYTKRDYVQKLQDNAQLYAGAVGGLAEDWLELHAKLEAQNNLLGEVPTLRACNRNQAETIISQRQQLEQKITDLRVLSQERDNLAAELDKARPKPKFRVGQYLKIDGLAGAFRVRSFTSSGEYPYQFVGLHGEWSDKRLSALTKEEI